VSGPGILGEVTETLDELKDFAGVDVDLLADGTGPHRTVLDLPAPHALRKVVTANNMRATVGMPRWSGLLLEAALKALVEGDRQRLRERLIVVAALAVAWVERIDRDTTSPEDVA
jgi:hypothetical protein